MKPWRQLALVFSCSAAITYGATFSQNDAGALGHSSMIDASGSGDYTSLSSAADEFSSCTGGLKGDYTFYIASDLTESTPSLFGNLTNGFSLIISPFESPRTITFTDVFSGEPCAGIVVGARDLGSAIEEAATDNFTLDGALSETTVGLVLRATGTVDDYVENAAVVRIIGACTNATIRGCRLEMMANSIGQTRCVLGEARCISLDGAENYVAAPSARAVRCEYAYPEASLVESCVLQASSQDAGSIKGIAGTASRPHVSECVFACQGAGIDLDVQHGAELTRNDISIGSENQSECVGIACSGDGEVEPLVVKDNKVKIDAGLAGYLVGVECGTPGSDQPALIANNMLAIFGDYEMGSNDTFFKGIDLMSSGSVVHNSIRIAGVIPSDTSEAGSGAAIAVRRNQPALVENNIISVEGMETDLRRCSRLNVACLRVPAVLEQVTCDGNVFDTTGPVAIGIMGGTRFWSLEDWQTSTGLDLRSQLFDPKPFWVSQTDPHFASEPIGLNPGLTDALALVPEDIDGDLRSTLGPDPGADEFVDLTSGVDLIPALDNVSLAAVQKRGQELSTIRGVVEITRAGVVVRTRASVRVHLSADNKLTPDDPCIVNRTVSPKGRTATQAVKFTTKLRTHVSRGSRLIAIVDPVGSVNETNERNNVVSVPLN